VAQAPHRQAYRRIEIGGSEAGAIEVQPAATRSTNRPRFSAGRQATVLSPFDRARNGAAPRAGAGHAASTDSSAPWNQNAFCVVGGTDGEDTSAPQPPREHGDSEAHAPAR
jgi:hypothetical protein